MKLTFLFARCWSITQPFSASLFSALSEQLITRRWIVKAKRKILRQTQEVVFKIMLMLAKPGTAGLIHDSKLRINPSPLSRRFISWGRCERMSTKLPVLNTTDPSLSPAPLGYCCRWSFTSIRKSSSKRNTITFLENLFKKYEKSRRKGLRYVHESYVHSHSCQKSVVNDEATGVEGRAQQSECKRTSSNLAHKAKVSESHPYTTFILFFLCPTRTKADAGLR